MFLKCYLYQQLNIKKHIPNTITLANLACGCLALIRSFEGNLIWAAYLVGIALLCDFLDGFLARLLKVSSPIGKDLDSLADMVTFGLVPGVVLYHSIYFSLYADDSGAFSQYRMDPNPSSFYLPYFALVVVIFSAIRLAKFNNDIRQNESFIGLPTPANAMVICSIPLILQWHGNKGQLSLWLTNPFFLIILGFVLSILLVSNIPLFALKFKNFTWKDNQVKYVFLLLALSLFVFLKIVAIPLIVILYIFLSIVNNIFLKKKV
jgi:CDP-diacylglycerol--serine O-phosphatidyltransferase